MKNYYVVNGSLSFGFGGYITQACLRKEEAEKLMETAKKKYRNITNIDIVEVQANNKKEACSKVGKSMFNGDFAGCDRVPV